MTEVPSIVGTYNRKAMETPSARVCYLLPPGLARMVAAVVAECIERRKTG